MRPQRAMERRDAMRRWLLQWGRHLRRLHKWQHAVLGQWGADVWTRWSMECRYTLREPGLCGGRVYGQLHAERDAMFG